LPSSVTLTTALPFAGFAMGGPFGLGLAGNQGAIVMPKGLYANINAKRARIASGSGEKMNKPGSKGAPTDAAFKASAKTAKKK
jgi:hypothetical protein